MLDALGQVVLCVDLVVELADGLGHYGYEAVSVCRNGTSCAGPTFPSIFQLLYFLARKFPHVQLIPTWIDNVQRVMPKGEVVPVPLLCTVTFGEPLSLEPDEDKRRFLERARDAVLAQRPRNA